MGIRAGFTAFILVAIVHTWPLATNPVHPWRNNSGNAPLNTWAIVRVAHQLSLDPRHLFDANIFYPERLTLAYSEAMIVQGVLAWSIIAAGKIARSRLQPRAARGLSVFSFR